MGALTSFQRWVRKQQAQFGLGHQVAIFAAGLCIVLVIAAAFLASSMARQHSISRIQRSIDSFAASTSDRLDQYLLDRLREIRQVASFEPLQPIWTGDPARVRSVLEEVQAGFPAYTWIGFARPDGKVAAATGGLLEGQSVAALPWFVHSSVAPTIEDVHDAPLLEGLFEAEQVSEPLRFVDVAVPVRGADGRTLGVLGAHLDWKWTSTIRQVALSRLDRRLQTDIWILNSDGTALLGPEFGTAPFDRDIIERIRRDGQATFIDERGGDVLTSAYRSPSGTAPARPRWIVVVRRPLGIAYAEANQIAGSIVIVGLLLGALGVAVAIGAGAHVGRPLRKLAASVDLIGRDPTVTTVPREHGSREVVHLSTAIRSLLRRLASAEDAEQAARKSASVAEQRMEERTRRLGEHIRTLQTLADTDPLTKLLNRRAFLTFATDAMGHFTRYGRELAILLVDIDLFKRVNDTYGHAVGDHVIAAVARAVEEELRTTDKAARFGGEEFVVLLRETNAQGAAALAERIRKTVADLVVDTPSEGAINVTVSVGMAVAHPSDRDVEDIIERADRGLYRAKDTGRNAVAAVDLDEGLANAAE